MPGGRMVDQRVRLLLLCTGWVMFPGCAVAAWHESEKPQPTFDPGLRLGQKRSIWECLAVPGTTYMPQHIHMIPTQRSKCAPHPCKVCFSMGRRWSLWAKGDQRYTSPPSHYSHLRHQGMYGSSDIASAPHSLQTKEIKKCVLPFAGMVLTVRTPPGKTEHFYDSYSSVRCCYTPFVQQLRWQLPSCKLGKESQEWKSGVIKPFFSSSPQQVFESWGDDN